MTIPSSFMQGCISAVVNSVNLEPLASNKSTSLVSPKRAATCSLVKLLYHNWEAGSVDYADDLTAEANITTSSALLVLF